MANPVNPAAGVPKPAYAAVRPLAGPAPRATRRPRQRPWLSAESALIAIGRLESALDRSPLEAAWQLRAQLDAATLLAQIDGIVIERERLYTLMAGLPVKRLKDYGAEAKALRLLEGLSALTRDAAGLSAGAKRDRRGVPPSPWLAAVRSAAAGMAATRDADGDLSSALRGVHRAVHGGQPLVAALAALPLALAGSGLVRRYLPALLFKPEAVGEGSEDAWLLSALERVERSATNGERLLVRLTESWRDWHRRLGQRRSTSKLPALVDAMVAWPVVTPAQASRTLGISVHGAAKLVDALARAGIVVPATARKSWRCYVGAEFKGAAALALEAAAPDGIRQLRGREKMAIAADAATSLYEERAVSGPIRADEARGRWAELDRETGAEPDLSHLYAEVELVAKRIGAAIDRTIGKPRTRLDAEEEEAG
jgi:hypothetical protein